MKKIKNLLIISIFLVMSNMSTIPVFAQDSITVGSAVYGYPPSSPTEEYRFITVVKDATWTSLETVEGQPTKGTYLKKGDSLFYGESDGKKLEYPLEFL